MNKKYWEHWVAKVTQEMNKKYKVVKREVATHFEATYVAALKYFELGIPVVPVKIFWNPTKSQWDKQPLIEWARWQGQKQTEVEFNELEWRDANGLAIVLGQKASNGFYVGVVDYDVKNLPDDAKEKGRQILELFPETRTEKTANGGLHLIYFVREQPENISQHHKVCGLELFGKRLIIMAPSHNYTITNDRKILEIDDLTYIFSHAIGIETKEKKQKEKRKKVKIRPCISALLKDTHLSHEKRCAVAFEYLNGGYTVQQIVELFKGQLDFDEATTKTQLEHAVKNEYLPYSETKLKEMGVCSGPECPQYGKEIVYAPSVVLEDGKIAEQGYDGTEVYYIIYDPKTEKATKEQFIELDDKVYLPILNSDVKTHQVFLPSEALDYGDETKLNADILAYLNGWHEQLDPVQRRLDLNYLKETWLKDLLPQIAYRRNLAKFGLGKSTYLEVMGAISYRGFFTSGCSSEASIRRTFNQWQGTAIIDEADFGDSDLYAVITKILNIGFDAKMGWYRCCDDNDSSKILSFYVYGPKLIATRERYKDTALESRCLTFFGMGNVGKLPLFRMERFAKEAQQLRNELLMWRFKHYNSLKEKLHVLENANLDEGVYGQVISVRSRVKQVVFPLLLIAEDEGTRNDLINFAERFNANLENLDMESAFERQVKQAINLLFSNADAIEKHKTPTETLKVYLHELADALEISEPKERMFWSRSISVYFRKRTEFPVRTGSRNKVYVLLPISYVEAVLKEVSVPQYDPNIPSSPNTEAEKPKDDPDWMKRHVE
jgi:hypothetical protein